MSPRPHNGKREKFNPQAMKRVMIETKKYWPLFIISAILILICTIIEVVSPNMLGNVTDHLAGYVNYLKYNGAIGNKLDQDYVFNECLRIMCLYVAIALMSYAASFMITTGVQRYCNKLRKQIIEKINRLPLSYFDSHATGDTMSRVTNDVDSVSQNLDQSLSMIFSSLFLLIGTTIAMFATSWILSLVAIATIPFMFVFLAFDMKLAEPAFRKRQKGIGEVNGIVEEDYGGQNIIKLFGAEKNMTDHFEERNQALGHTMYVAQIYGGLMMPISNLFSNISYALVILVSGLLIADNQKFGVGFGTLTSFLIYIRLFQQPFSQISQALNSVQTISAASGRVFEFLAEEELSSEEGKKRLMVGENGLEEVKGEVEFDHVSFGYDPSRTIIHDFTAKVKPGMKVAIVGPTGAGKTTMVNLLMRFYEINQGSIKIDGVDCKDMSREEIHDIFGMVLQDSWVFNGTVRENLVYNSKWVSEERIEQVLKDAKLDRFVASLPGGLDYEISETSELSGGQKQLLTIARAMIRKAPLLILDEATSNVDTRTEEMIQQAMDSLTEGRTSFVIAHRLSTIRNADLILVMKDGDIIEQGNHDTLMKQNGFYAGLYNSQFSLE